MCTAVAWKSRDFYFGRTLDLDESYREEVTITPRSFPLPLRNGPVQKQHHAIIGMAYVVDNYPLYYDAVNEKGLAMAGLHFEDYARFGSAEAGSTNIASFELIPWVLGSFESVFQARKAFDSLRITDDAFLEDMPPSPLHWILCDREECVTIECTKDGLHIYDNPVGVLTNAPEFPQQLFCLNNYMALSPRQPENRFFPGLPLQTYSNGMGALGLPGDLSSQSRFVRAAFTKGNAVPGMTEQEHVGQFFHILETVSQTRGCCEMENGALERTIYTSCCNADKGIYYYTTYHNRQITAVDMHKTDLRSRKLMRYPLRTEENIRFEPEAP